MTNKAAEHNDAPASSEPGGRPKQPTNSQKKLQLLISGLSESVVEPQTGKVILEPWNVECGATSEAEEEVRGIMRQAECECKCVQ